METHLLFLLTERKAGSVLIDNEARDALGSCRK